MARRSKSGAANAPNPLGWMVTFSDLITLLLTFFVLLISMSSMDVKKLKQSMNMFTEGSGPMELSSDAQIRLAANVINNMDMLSAQMVLDSKLKELLFDFDDAEFKGLMDLVDPDIKVKYDERGLVIQMASYILFNEGGSELRMEFLPILARIANVLRASRRPVSVEGHTDGSPLEGGADAWAFELSLERAIATASYFIDDERLMPERFRVGGYGPSKPLEVKDVEEEEDFDDGFEEEDEVGEVDDEAQATSNRRIEIILYKDKN